MCVYTYIYVYIYIHNTGKSVPITRARAPLRRSRSRLAPWLRRPRRGSDCASRETPCPPVKRSIGHTHTETKKQSPNTEARANNTLHKELGYPIGEPAKHTDREQHPTPTHTRTRQQHPKPSNEHLPQTLNNARRWRDDGACHLPRRPPVKVNTSRRGHIFI